MMDSEPSILSYSSSGQKGGGGRFSGDTTTTILFKIVSDPPLPIEREATQGISPGIRGVLDMALAKEPAERFQSAEDLAQALRACKDPTWPGGLDAATSRLTRDQTPVPLGALSARAMLAQGPAARPRRTGLYLYLSGAVALLAAAGAFAVLRSRPGPGQPMVIPAAANPQPPPPPPTPAPAEAAPERPPAPEDPLKSIGQRIDSDPLQASAGLGRLVLAQPSSVELQGNYLAALYRSGNAQEFERALTRARANGVTVKGMLAVAAFRAAMADESRLQKAHPPSGVLPREVMGKLLEGL